MGKIATQGQLDNGQSLIKLNKILMYYSLDVYLDDETGYIVYNTAKPLELEEGTGNLVDGPINEDSIVLRASSLTEVVIFVDGLVFAELYMADKF